MHYECKYFYLYELLPRDTYFALEHRENVGWWLLDRRILWTADAMREKYGDTIYINDWMFDGYDQFCGWRPPFTDVGAIYSQHRFGRALDMHFRNHTAEEIREDIINKKYPETFKYITAIEKGVSWLHIDCRNYDGLLVFGKD